MLSCISIRCRDSRRHPSNFPSVLSPCNFSMEAVRPNSTRDWSPRRVTKGRITFEMIHPLYCHLAHLSHLKYSEDSQRNRLTRNVFHNPPKAALGEANQPAFNEASVITKPLPCRENFDVTGFTDYKTRFTTQSVLLASRRFFERKVFFFFPRKSNGLLYSESLWSMNYTVTT